MEFSAGLVAFLEFALETAEDVVECEATLSRWEHAAAHVAWHADEPPRLHRRTALATSSGSLTIKVESITGTGGGHVLVVA